MEDISKVIKSFEKLFLSLYGETFLIKNAIKIKFEGAEGTHYGKTIYLTASFNIISTNKSFTYSYLFTELLSVTDRAIKYIHSMTKYQIVSNITFVNTDVLDIYMTDSDEKFMDTSFYNLEKLTIPSPYNPDVVNVVDIKPLMYQYHFDDSGQLIFTFDVFLKGGSITLPDGEEYTIPFHHSLDDSVRLIFETKVQSKEIEGIVETFMKNTLSNPDHKRPIIKIRPTF